MPIGLLKFKLPEEEEAFYYAQEGISYSIVIEELDNFLRNKIKYAPDDANQIVIDTYQEIRDHLTSLVNERGLK